MTLIDMARGPIFDLQPKRIPRKEQLVRRRRIACHLEEAKHHESFYLYDEATLEESIRRLKNTFAHTQILYSIKCNPNRAVLKKFFTAGIDADAASLGEVYTASDCGVP